VDFIEDMVKQIKVIKENLTEEKIDILERQAHTIKGSSATVGGVVLREVAYAMEKSGKKGDFKAIKGALPTLENEFDRLKTEINKFIS